MHLTNSAARSLSRHHESHLICAIGLCTGSRLGCRRRSVRQHELRTDRRPSHLTRSYPLVDAGFNEPLLALPLRSFDRRIRVAAPRIDSGAYALDGSFGDGFDPSYSTVQPMASP